MIYLFRKRNKQILAVTKESADRTFNSPNNFITHQPEYLGAVSDEALKEVGRRAEEEAPIQMEKLVKKDGEDTLVTLTQEQIVDAVKDGDKAMEARYSKLLKTQKARYEELMEELASTADKSSIPPSYSKKVGMVEDASGDLSAVLKGYVHE